MPEPTPSSEFFTLAAALELLPAEGDAPRRFKMAAYDGGLLRLANFPVPLVVDLAGMEPVEQVKALLNHDPGKPVGHMTDVRIGTAIAAEGLLSVPAHAGDILAAQRNGFQWEASIGATMVPGSLEKIADGGRVTVNGRTFTGPLAVARKTRLREISFVGAGAGENTSAALAAMAAVSITQGETMPLPKPTNDPTPETKPETQPQPAPETKPETKPTPAPETKPTPASDVSVEVQEIRASLRDEIAELRREREALRRERLVESVDRLAKQYGCGDFEITAALKQKAAAGDAAETDIELEILRASRSQRVAGLQPIGRAKDGPAASHVIEAAICLTNGWGEAELKKHFDEKTINEAIAARFSGFGVRSLMVEYLKGKGHDVIGGRLTDEDIKAALTYSEQETQIRAGGGFSTLSLPGITSNVANKELLRGYDAFRPAILTIARRSTAMDYKPKYLYRLNASDGLLYQVGGDGELKSMELTEDEYQSRVYPFGRKLAITDVMIRNDDLSAFADLARLFGITAARTVEKTGFTTLLATVSSFWTTGQGNRITDGASAALDIDSLGSAYALFLAMEDSVGNPIGLEPKYLLTGPADFVTAKTINQSTTVNLALAGTTDAVSERPQKNPFQGMFEPLYSPYLANAAVTNANGTQWLLCADPMITSPIVAAFLDGVTTPRIRPWEALPGRLGMQWDTTLSFGFNLHDPRASVYSKGQA